MKSFTSKATVKKELLFNLTDDSEWYLLLPYLMFLSIIQ